MASTRSELRTRVENVTKRTDKTTVINDALDIGLREIEINSRHFWRDLVSIESLSVSDGDTSEALTANTHHVFGALLVDGTQSYRIRVLSRRQFLTWFPNVDDASESIPTHAYFDKSNIYFSAPMSSDNTVKVMSYILSTFASDATECPILDVENALSFYAISFLYGALEMFSASAFWERKYLASLTTAMMGDLWSPATEFIAEGFKGMPMDDNEWINWTPDSLSV